MERFNGGRERNARWAVVETTELGHPSRSEPVLCSTDKTRDSECARLARVIYGSSSSVLLEGDTSCALKGLELAPFNSRAASVPPFPARFEEVIDLLDIAGAEHSKILGSVRVSGGRVKRA